MAKKVSSVSVLPTAVSKQVDAELPKQNPVDNKISSTQVLIEMPVLSINGYSKKRIDLTLTGREASAAKALKDGAEMNELQLPNGKYISTPADAIKMLLNMIADEMGI